MKIIIVLLIFLFTFFSCNSSDVSKEEKNKSQVTKNFSLMKPAHPFWILACYPTASIIYSKKLPKIINASELKYIYEYNKDNTPLKCNTFLKGKLINELEYVYARTGKLVRILQNTGKDDERIIVLKYKEELLTETQEYLSLSPKFIENSKAYFYYDNQLSYYNEQIKSLKLVFDIQFSDKNACNIKADEKNFEKCTFKESILEKVEKCSNGNNIEYTFIY